MKNNFSNSYVKGIFLCLLLLLCLLFTASCGNATKRKVNTANLNLDIGIGFSHFDNESDYPEPSEKAYLDVYSSKIIIRDAYEDTIIETPLIYNNSSTAYPRKQLVVCGNRMYVIYCPDISVPNLQIASTDDGGSTWIQSTVSLDTNEISSIDRFTASFWSTKSGALIIASGMVDTFVYFTSDAGKTWTRAPGSPPSQNWHDSLYSGAFLSDNIGAVSYSYYSYPPDEPQVYLTLDGSTTWEKLEIKVPASIMESYALAGAPFYDGTKINIPIEIYDHDGQLSETVYYVSYDLGITWEFFADDEEALELIRVTEMQAWFEKNRPAELSENEYTHSEFSLYSSFSIAEDVRVDAYKLVTIYPTYDLSALKLTGNMYFDKNANLYYKQSEGWPILLYIYRGDVFSHTYTLLGSCPEEQYKAEGEEHLGKRLYEELRAREELETLFAEASEAYAYFTVFTPDIETGSSIEYRGEKYDEVHIKDITTLSALRDYVSAYFSDDITEDLMQTTVTSELLPLFYESDGKLYRFSGYSGEFTYNDIDVQLTVDEISDKNASLTLSVDTALYDKQITFSYVCEASRDTDGKLKFSSYSLPIIRAIQIFSENENTHGADTSEAKIYDIDDWDKLSYTAAGGEQIRRFLDALISGNTAALPLYASATDSAVFAEYAKLRISSYTIEKCYVGGQSKIKFTYTIDKQQPGAAVPMTQIGTHSAYVVVGTSSVYLSQIEKTESDDIEKYFSDFFSSTLDYTVPDCSDLNYQQSIDITDFIVRRIGGTSVSRSSITEYAKSVFGVSDFAPSSNLIGADGTYSALSRGNRSLSFDIISRTTFGDETAVSVMFYADESKLVAAKVVDYTIVNTSADYKITEAYTTQTSDFRIFKTLA